MSEDKIQVSAVAWFNNNYCLKFHEPKMSIESSPNEVLSKVKKLIPDKVFFKLMSWLKAMGMKSGTSDLKVYLNGGKTLFIEMKDHKGTQSQAQKDFQKTVEDLGFKYYLCRSVNQFKEIILSEL